jgi:hypothetical protein
MTSKELNEDLLLNFPELRERFEDVTSWQEGIETGSFVVFEDVFMPFIKESIKNNSKDIINRIFEYIEKLFLNKDEYVQNVLYVAVLENIASFEDKQKYIKYFKNNTLKIFDKNYK